MKDLSLKLDDATDTFPALLTDLPVQAMQNVLFFHCARLYPLSPTYIRQQLNALTFNQHHELNHLARACQYFARQRSKGHSDHEILRRMTHSPVFDNSAELIARALLNLQVLAKVREQPRYKRPSEVTLPYPLFAAPRPTQPGLLRALLRWPDNDVLLQRVLAALSSQPSVSLAFRRYATNYTQQQKLLDLKASLLLLGPQRSREIVLLAHFETSLVQPGFPLKPDLMQRYQLIRHMLALLSARFDAILPVRPDLLAYLLIYDAWRAPEWLVAGAWTPAVNFPVYRVDYWLQCERPHQHRVAKRLCDYWRLPKQLGPLLTLESDNPALNHIVALSIAAVDVVQKGIHEMNAHHYVALKDVDQFFGLLSGQRVEHDGIYAYLKLCWQAAVMSSYACTVPRLMRP